MNMGKEVYTQKTDFLRLFKKKVVSDCVKMGLSHEKTSY